MGFSDYFRQAALAAALGKTSNFGTLSAAPSWFIGLSSTLPASDGTNVTEPTGGSYARIALTSAHFGAPTSADPSVSTTLLLITFPTPTADWLVGAELPWAVFYDALTVGNFLDWGVIANPRTVRNGDAALKIPIGQMGFELEDE